MAGKWWVCESLTNKFNFFKGQNHLPNPRYAIKKCFWLPNIFFHQMSNIRIVTTLFSHTLTFPWRYGVGLFNKKSLSTCQHVNWIFLLAISFSRFWNWPLHLTFVVLRHPWYLMPNRGKLYGKSSALHYTFYNQKEDIFFWTPIFPALIILQVK